MKKGQVASLLLFITAVLTFFMWSCNGDDIEPSDINFDYFPLEVGSYIIYEVDSTVYDEFNDVVNRRTLQVREIVESVFTDAAGHDSYRIERQYRDGDSDNWGSAGYNIWFAEFEENNAERIEENQRYIKIAFPVRLGKTWPGNIHINVDPDGPLGYLDGWEYEITSLDEPMTLNNLSFDSTMTIIQESSGTVIDTIGAREVYARDVGMIFRELWVLESQCTDCLPSDPDCIRTCQDSAWIYKAEDGFIVKETIIEYGNL